MDAASDWGVSGRDGISSRSIDWGRVLLVFFPLSLLGVACSGGSFGRSIFAEVPWDMSMEFALFGCLSERSPTTASSPVSGGSGLFPGDLGVSLDQNAHDEPATGFAVGSGTAGGASSTAASTVSLPACDMGVLFLASSPLPSCPVAMLGHSQLAARWPIVIGTGCSFETWAAGSSAGASVSTSLGGSEDASGSAGGERPNHPPSHPDDVVGCSASSVAGGASGIGASTLLPASCFVPTAPILPSCFVSVASSELVWDVPGCVDEDCVSAGVVVSCKLLGALTEAELAPLRLALSPVLFKS